MTLPFLFVSFATAAEKEATTEITGRLETFLSQCRDGGVFQSCTIPQYYIFAADGVELRAGSGLDNLAGVLDGQEGSPERASSSVSYSTLCDALALDCPQLTASETIVYLGTPPGDFCGPCATGEQKLSKLIDQELQEMHLIKVRLGQSW